MGRGRQIAKVARPSQRTTQWKVKRLKKRRGTIADSEKECQKHCRHEAGAIRPEKRKPKGHNAPELIHKVLYSRVQWTSRTPRSALDL